MNTAQLEFIKYLLSPAITATILWFILERIYKIGRINQLFETALEDIKYLKTKVSNLAADMIVVKTHLISKDKLDSTLFSANSPLSLTPKGFEVLKEVGFDTLYYSSKDEFLTKIKTYNVRKMVDVDDAATAIVQDMQMDPRLEKVREVAFKNGLTTDEVLKACSIYLREEAAKALGITLNS